MNVEGGCLCGAVRYAVEGRPLLSIICHCRTCRRASGAPSVAWLTFECDKFRLLAGSLREFPSSTGVRRSFCGTCGTPVTYTSEQFGDIIDVTTASLDDPLRYPPTLEAWLDHRIDWEATSSARAQHPRASFEAPDDAA
jgi:hypothetical protein